MLPKEQLTAWQRWELASFDTDQPHKSASGMHLPTVNELETIREQAQKEGYAAGHQEGLQAGKAEGHLIGHNEGLRAGLEESRAANAPIAERLNQLLAAFDHDLAQADQAIAVELLTLSADLAKAMLKTALPIRPDLLLPLISETIAALPVMQRNGKLHLHPDDVPLVKSQMHEEVTLQGWQILEDPRITPGGCRIETHSNLLDASLESRWQRLMKQLGQNTDWLDDASTR